MLAASRLLNSLCVLLVTMVLAPPVYAQEQEYEKRAPYAALRWDDDAAQVELDGTWYALLSIDGQKVEDILAYCRKTWPDRWQKRFAEDLVEVLTGMQHPPGDTVVLGLRDEKSGAVTLRSDVPMTNANREALRKAGGGRYLERTQREHATKPDPRYAALARPLVGPGTELDRASALRDLDQLEAAVRSGFAYRDRLGVDVSAAFDAVRLACPERVLRPAFTARIQELLALFGDGHSRVVGLDEHRRMGWLPFRLEETDVGIVAVAPPGGKAKLFDEEHPIVVAIDGVPLERWMEYASAGVARGAPHFVRRQCLRDLRYVAHVRAEAGLPAKETLDVELRSLDGRSTKHLELGTREGKLSTGIWPLRASRLLGGNIGYLRIERMDADTRFVDAILESLEGFRDARALVIDVRGNGGGKRDLLLRIYPYLAGPKDPPRVVNIAARVLAPGDDRDRAGGWLADRFMFPASWSGWSDAARKAIQECASKFEPEWVPKEQPLSAWHYLVLDRGESPPAWSFTGPVVILLDSACFSATDIFLAALEQLPNVTLVGTPSGGGSGRAREIELENVGITVRLSSMVSYRVDGKLFEGRGVQPDALVLPAPNDLIGLGDAMLDAALARLR